MLRSARSDFATVTTKLQQEYEQLQKDFEAISDELNRKHKKMRHCYHFTQSGASRDFTIIQRSCINRKVVPSKLDTRKGGNSYR